VKIDQIFTESFYMENIQLLHEICY